MKDDDLLDNEPLLEQWEPPAPPTPGNRHIVWLPALLLLAGVFLILFTAILDERAAEKQLWNDALLLSGPVEDVPGGEGVIPVSLRRLPAPRSPLLDALQASKGGPQAIERLELDKAEWVVLLPAPDEVLSQLLDSGRLPSRGRFEALAGDLATGKSFELVGHQFEVVGQLKRSVGGLGYSYVVPDDPAFRPLFANNQEAKHGLLVTHGPKHLRSLSEEQLENLRDNIVGTPTRAGRGVALATVLGLVMVALGGSMFYYQIFMRLRDRRVRGIQTLLQDIHDWPGLFIAMHVLLYGVFFLMMLLAIADPLTSFRVGRFVSHELSQGTLSHIGQAYASGDILLAAIVTFTHNYFLATIFYTIVPSLVIPFLGVIKNLLTFLVVGFAMSPLWSGAAAGMSFHSITMAIELGAYIVASFAMTVYALRIFRGIAQGRFVPALRQSLETAGGACLVSGAMLAFAGLYEAFTIILLG